MDNRGVPEAMVDWAPALAVAVIGQLDLGLTEPWAGSNAARGVLAVLVALPLGWRRTAPRAVITVVLGFLLAQSLFVDPALTFGSFLAVVVATYAVAKHTRGRDALVGAGVVVLGVAVITARMGAESPFELVFPIVYFGGTWLLGRGMRTREVRTAQLGELTRQLEAQRDRGARLAVADERARVARELHDIVAHTVSTIVLQAEAADEVFETDPERARDRLKAIQTAGREGLGELRRLLNVLRADDEQVGPAHPQPGIEALTELADRMRATGMQVRLEIEDPLPSLSAGLQLSVYRIVQEALTNTLRHAGPVSVQVGVRHQRGAVHVEVVDEGGPAATEATSNGHGLVGMRERAAMFGGSVDAAPTARGFAVSAVLPFGEDRGR